MNIALIDNFDSFTYNLVHILEQFADEIQVVRYNLVQIDSLEQYDRIILSPGPGLPSDLEKLNQIIEMYSSLKPILGICLGHQAIAEYFGAKLKNLKEPDHGIQKNTIVIDKKEILFREIPEKFLSGRYHSWAANDRNFPDELKITAIDEDNRIMGISHKTLNIKGLQFHPESIMTEYGKEILENWIKYS
ncbi:MAG: aminodeoxychorismate/anthranilate synthase component II [Bacteroidetes bacterium]|nr:aminodeoxychorismate/anthranilate synthase component II [Bacteroidota bacterium]MBT6686178.1 aminodeoxychorismate/anthranilate synthase component II [Bacteroidota bacterium]MBT7143889.1 aminodeoxychorismate/anthranilate synthase component II [Bacteroidota bacterium]MBT7491244.1 aminodeoxychorismate/anthranilate synthase component II [Bacteroidota bacterium]